MNITILGSGNVGTVLKNLFERAGHRITVLNGREDMKPIGADIYIVAITDDALYDLKQRLQLNDELIVHTAGSVSIDVLKDISANYGILYPLQSIRKELTIPAIPFLIDANTEENKIKIKQLAETITDNVQFADDDKRRKLHLSAVITNNFINHLFTLTQEYCKNESIDFNILQPLIHETITRINNTEAKSMQTGPALRNDQQTIKKQRDMLAAYPSLLKLYDAFTASIINYHS